MESRRILGLSLSLTLGFGLVELLAGFYTNSLTLLSDAGHMFTDSIALFIAFVGVLISSIKGSPRMTYGLRRAEVLAGFMNALLLVFLIGYVLYSAVMRFFHPSQILALPMLAVAFLGLIVNLAILFMLYGHSRESLSFKTAFLHVVFDTVGSISAVIAGLVLFFTGYHMADSLVSLGLILLILPQIYNLLRLSLEIFLQFAPSDVPLLELQNRIKNLPYVKDVHDLHLWSLTSRNFILTAHVVVEDTRLSSKAIGDIDRIAKAYNIEHVTLQVEDQTYPCPCKEACIYLP